MADLSVCNASPKPGRLLAAMAKLVMCHVSLFLLSAGLTRAADDDVRQIGVEPILGQELSLGVGSASRRH